MPALFSTLLTAVFLGCTGLTLVYLHFAPELPDNKALHQVELQVPLRIYSREEKLLAEFGVQRRRPVDFDAIPARLREAFIAIEDARYYDHPGIDFRGVLRALYSVVSTGQSSQGASTITMQLARNIFLSREKTLERKLKETLLAIRLEQTLRKDEILELYLNKIYLGNNAYGVAAAAETYYGKENLQDLTLAQMAMIAGLPKAPSRYNPIANPKRAMIRRDYILKRMLDLGYIDEGMYRSAVTEPNTARIYKPQIETDAPYFAEMVRSTIVEKYQDKAYTQGLHVFTTLDSGQQQYTTEALRKTLLDYDRRHGYRGAEDHIQLDGLSGREEWLDKLSSYPELGGLLPALVIASNTRQAELLLQNETTITLDLEAVRWARPYVDVDHRKAEPNKVSEVLSPGDIVRVQHFPRPQPTSTNSKPAASGPEWQLAQLPAVAGAMVLMDPYDGAVRAISGGFDFRLSKFNRATMAMRQPGSSFKPFVYSAALSRGMTPTSIVNDAPITIPGTNWKPQNFGGKYIGPTTLSEALAKSRNLVSIRLLRSTGIDYTIDYATRFGFEQQHLPRNLTLALGTGLTNPLQMATAYSSFANGGFKINAYFINRIEDNDGKVLFDAIRENPRACGDNRESCPAVRPEPKQPEHRDMDTAGTAGAGDEAETVTAAPPTPVAPRIMLPRTQRQIVGMMEGVTEIGTAAKVRRTLKRKDLAGKTGTTNDQKDAWFCGFTPDYVAVAWSGFDNMSELGEGETSTRVAVPMWIELMKNVLKAQPERQWPFAPDLKQAGRVPQKSDPDLGGTTDAKPESPDMAAVDPAPEQSRYFEYKSVRAESRGAEPVSLPATAATQRYRSAAPVPRPPSHPTIEQVEIPEQIF
ncbi:MAG TPA: penicillin-binding protein 1A [Thiolinea sp.]|nr:penicillin-binding protein 1A [Thiolinea sp.]